MIEKFEKNNKIFDFKINIFSWYKLDEMKPTIKPIRISKDQSKIIVNLLLLNNHYYYIKNFNRLICSYDSYNHYYCVNCLSGFKTKLYLDKHQFRCLTYKPCTTILPDKDYNILYFREFEQTMQIPYVMYADFEAILEKTNSEINTKTRIIQNHLPCGFSLLVIKGNKKIVHHSFYRGIDCIEIFLQTLRKISEQIYNKLTFKKPMIPLNDEEIIKNKSANICHIYKDDFTISHNIDGFMDFKCKDHCHLTGKYRGAAHQSCNLRFQVPEFIPLFFHNLKG